MHERINSSIDWINPLHFSHQHADRYMQQIKHIKELKPEEGVAPCKDPKLPGLTPQEALRVRDFALHKRVENLYILLEQNGINVTRKNI